MRQMYRVQFCEGGKVIASRNVYATSTVSALEEAHELANESDLYQLDYDEIRILTSFRVAELQDEQLKKEAV